MLYSATSVRLARAEDKAILEKLDLFRAGEGGYALYHIPGITVTAKGTVLAWAEARRGRSDWTTIDILLRRSTDHGKSWSRHRKSQTSRDPRPRIQSRYIGKG